MITLEDVTTEVPFDDYAFLESHLAHEKKRMGIKGFCDKYVSKLDEFKSNHKHWEFCYLLSYLEYINQDFIYNSDVRLSGYFLDAADQLFFEEELYEEIGDLNQMYENAIPCFRKRGFLLSNIGEAC